MATKLTAISFIIAALIVVITIAIVSVPNLISYTISVSMSSVMDLRSKTSVIPGMIPPQMPQPATPLPHGIGDYQMTVSFGIWRCGVVATIPSVPMQITWTGSYASLGDKVETTANQQMSAMDQMGVPTNLVLVDGAVSTMADLMRTMFVRAEIEATIALIFSFVALAMTFVNMCVKEGQSNPLVNTCAAVCHLIQAILLGVALGGFAQWLHQVSSMGHMFTFVKITDTCYGLLVLGYLVVLTSILLSLTQFWMFVSLTKEPYKRFGQSEVSVAYPAGEKFKLSGEYDV